MSGYKLTIDRIVLTDLGLTPHQAEGIRDSLEAELQRMLNQGELPEIPASSEISRIEAPSMHLAGSHGNSHLARSLAQSIALAMRKTGER